MISQASTARYRLHHQGFTLIEITIVLVIASLIIAAGIGMTSTLLDGARLRVTRQNLETAKLAIQGFISRNGRLPCPAVETMAPSDALYGLEDVATTVPATSCTNTVALAGAAGIDAGKRGVLPWKTLGLNVDSATDGWGNQITYMVSVTSTTVNFETLSGIRGSLYVHSTTPVAAGLPATGNQINACSTTANDNACNRASVAVLISHGRNASGAYLSTGTRAPLPTGAAEVENTNADRFVVNAEPSGTFDDVLLPLSPNDLLLPLATQGSIKSERALLIERARQVITQMIGEVVPTQAGTSPNISYTLPVPTGATNYTFATGRFNTSCDAPYNTAGVATGVVSNVTGDAAQVLDPWGNVFKFGRATILINSSESCLTPVAIISLGADGTLGTADDFVYYSPMAEWKEILGKVGW